MPDRELIFHNKSAAVCMRCGEQKICIDVLSDDRLKTFCADCIMDAMVVGYCVSNFRGMPDEDHIVACSGCAAVGVDLYCEDCAESNFVNKCDNCSSDNQVLCQDCAKEEWSAGECSECSDPATLCEGHAECSECSDRATLCDSHAECARCANRAYLCEECASSNESTCNNCGDTPVEYCANCATAQCSNCGGAANFCEDCAEPECVVCSRNFAVDDVVCPACKQSKVADGVVTFDPNQSYTIRYKET